MEFLTHDKLTMVVKHTPTGVRFTMCQVCHIVNPMYFIVVSVCGIINPKEILTHDKLTIVVKRTPGSRSNINLKVLKMCLIYMIILYR